MAATAAAAALPSFPSTSCKLPPNPNSTTIGKFENNLHIPPLLRPLLRAYILGYASSTAPRLISLVLRHWRRNRKSVNSRNPHGREPSPYRFFHSLLAILRGGLELQRFPTSCALLAGGSTLLRIPIQRWLEKWVKAVSSSTKARLARWIATFISAYLSLALLQSKQTPDFTDYVPPNTYCKTTGQALTSTYYAGRTLDLTLFASTRALDILIGSLWHSYSTPGFQTHKITAYLADPFMFASSSALVMWSFIYFPTRLPRNYNNWINTAANVDPHLITALRACRQGTIAYGQSYPPNSPALVLQDMCREYGWPLEWGDPGKTVPFPCAMVHMHDGPNCEWHALSRWVRSFRWALEYNLPLNILLKMSNPTRDRLRKAVVSSLRSSAFLATFISLFYYSICLCRTRSQQFRPTRRLIRHLLGIKENRRSHPDFSPSRSKNITSTSSTDAQNVNPPSTSTPPLTFPSSTPPPPPPSTSATITPHQQTHQALDSGLCILSGCVTCGWSILLESSTSPRRAELALFVLPRALRTLWDKRYATELEWMERVVFAGSAAVVVDAVLGPGSSKGGLRAPRGVFGRLVDGVFS